MWPGLSEMLGHARTCFTEIPERGDPRSRFISELVAAKRAVELGCGKGNNCRVLRKLFPMVEIYSVDPVEGE